MRYTNRGSVGGQSTRHLGFPIFVASFLAPSVLLAQSSSAWPFAGHDILNSRFASSESYIGTANAGTLTARWIYVTENDVSATPSVDPVSKAVYFPDWSGNIIKLNSANGAVIWVHNVSEFGYPSGVISRTTPTLAGAFVIIGVSGTLSTPVNDSAFLIALDSQTGTVVWQTQLDPSPYALMTSSPIVNKNVIYAGVSSTEENLETPTFRGSVLAISLANGGILWRSYTVPTGYSGGPVWSSTPAVDVQRNQLYVTTGNNYTVPVGVQQCEQAASGNSARILACQSKQNLFDSIVALDLTTGSVRWSHRCGSEDNFLWSCIQPGGACPDPAGDDYDFGSGPNLFTVNIDGVPTQRVGAGQKSGVYWALDPDTGDVVWKTQVGPGGRLGGIEWGTAADNAQIYLAIANATHVEYILQPSGVMWDGGSWAALDARTGKIVWQVIDPGMDPVQPGEPAMALAAVTIANGVLYCASMSGHMYALDASSGLTLWTYSALGSVNAAPSIVNGSLYWGSGYHNIPAGIPIGTASNRFYSFGLAKGGGGK